MALRDQDRREVVGGVVATCGVRLVERPAVDEDSAVATSPINEKRIASTRSDVSAMQPAPGRAQWSVGSIEDAGIRYCFVTSARMTTVSTTSPLAENAATMAIRFARAIGYAQPTKRAMASTAWRRVNP
jgi:hypothetical protein